EDKKKREKVETINRADQLAYQTEKNIKELGDKLDSESKNKLEAAVGRLREAIKTENVSEINAASEDLNKIWNDVSSKMYQQSTAGQAQTETGASEEAPSGEKVQEAEYEVVDDDTDKK
ncbi:MAG: molecular chaperone DnaK, partial [Calditrichaeota bacterium]